jgi:hypothetical protein
MDSRESDIYFKKYMIYKNKYLNLINKLDLIQVGGTISSQ